MGEMKPCALCKQVKSLDDFHRNPKAKDGKTSRCRTCRNEYSKQWHWANRDKHLEMNRAYYASDPEKNRERAAKWRKANPERAKLALSDWLEKNKDRVRIQQRARIRNWKSVNRGPVNADKRKRYAAQRQAIPAWCDLRAVREIYVRAAEMRKAGHDVQVDHVVPLVSPLVCGFHVPSNLAIVPASYNIAKGNRVWPEMP